MNKVLAARKDYHNACRVEKSTANQENNARADTAVSSDQVHNQIHKINNKKTQNLKILNQLSTSRELKRLTGLLV